MKNILISAGLWLACAFFLSRNLFLPISVYDEGFILCGASRVLQGAWPHKDFLTAYPLGQYYALAAVFSAFGESVMAERIWDIAIRSFIALAGFWLVRSVASRRLALLAFVAMSTWLWFAGMMGFPGYPYLLCAFLAVGALMMSRRFALNLWCAIAGLCAGVSALFRHDMGLLAIAAITGVLALFALHARLRHDPDAAPLWRAAWIFPVWAAVPPLIALGLLLGAGCGPDLRQQLWEWPRIYTAHCTLPYPRPLWLLDLSGIDSLKAFGRHLVFAGLPFWLPMVVGLAGLYAAGALLFKRRLQPVDLLFGLLLAVGLSTIHYAVVRPDFEHFAPLTMVAIAVSFVAIAIVRPRFPRLSMALLILVALYWCLPLAAYTVRGSGPIPGMPEELRKTVEYLNEHHAGEAIYVGVENHDRFVFNDSVIYFLADVKYGTKYHALASGTLANPAVQMEIEGELRSNQVQTVVLTIGMRNEPNLSNVDQGIDLIDRYIAANYQCATNFGEYRILTRRRGESDGQRDP